MKHIYQTPFRQTAFKLLSALALIYAFSLAGFGQTTQTVEIQVVKVPDQVMKEVVRRILTSYFKPRDQAKTVYLSENGIKQTWLPKIKNIEFRLLTAEEFEKSGKSAYLFTETTLTEDTYSIGFGFGDSPCNLTGDSWYFRFINQKVELQQNGRFARGCGRGSGDDNE
jgi:hypothetical protein